MIPPGSASITYSGEMLIDWNDACTNFRRHDVTGFSSRNAASNSFHAPRIGLELSSEHDESHARHEALIDEVLLIDTPDYW